ncbi:MAG TPA: ABC transporter permease [Polyangiaceae bacterium]|nr:ABC transporter permease [Polyangiaceae bacterium]
MSDDRNAEAHTGTASIEGALDIAHGREIYHRLMAFAEDAGCASLALNLERVTELDSVGVALLFELEKSFAARGKRLELRGLPPRLAERMALVPKVPPPAAGAPGARPLARVAKVAARWQHDSLALAELVVDSARYTFSRRSLSTSRLAALVDQSIEMGANGVPIVALLSALVGVVLAFQGAYQLQRFGADMFVAEVVSLGMVREFGPLITAIIVAGRTGAAIAAELGTMAVREEIDALRALGIDPVAFLVLPRLLAITLALPALTLFSMVIGMVAGLGVTSLLELPVSAVLWRMRDALVLDDFVLGFVKSVLFAWLIGITGCFLGLSTRGGPTAVGKQTTRSVVVGIFLIVVCDSAVTTLWTLGLDE